MKRHRTLTLELKSKFQSANERTSNPTKNCFSANISSDSNFKSSSEDPCTQSPSTRTTNKQFASRTVSPSPHNGQENLETSSSLEPTVLEQIPQRLLANLDDPNEMDKASGKSSARRPCMDTGRPNASRSLAPGTGTSYFPRCRRNRSLLRN